MSDVPFKTMSASEAEARRQLADMTSKHQTALSVVADERRKKEHAIAERDALRAAMEHILRVQGIDDAGGTTWQCGQIARAALGKQPMKTMTASEVERDALKAAIQRTLDCLGDGENYLAFEERAALAAALGKEQP